MIYINILCKVISIKDYNYSKGLWVKILIRLIYITGDVKNPLITNSYYGRREDRISKKYHT